MFFYNLIIISIVIAIISLIVVENDKKSTINDFANNVGSCNFSTAIFEIQNISRKERALGNWFVYVADIPINHTSFIVTNYKPTRASISVLGKMIGRHYCLYPNDDNKYKQLTYWVNLY